MKLLVHASGYRNVPPFLNDQQEIRCVLHPRCGGIRDCHWSPSSRDFAVAGTASGGSVGAGSIDELLAVIGQQAVEGIEELRIIAHANDQMFCLAGEVRRDDVYFTKDNAWIGPSDAFKAAMPRFRDLQDRFTADAKIVLLGCNAGSGNDAILEICSHAFLRKVCGFKKEIKYNFEWGPTGAAVRDGQTVICVGLAATSRILIRARMFYSTMPEELEVLQPQPNASAFTTNAWSLTPDSVSNAGDIFIPVRRSDAGAGAVELVCRILQEFFPNHVWVSGFSADPAVTGLRVRRKPDGHVFIDAAPDFAKKTTPRNLKSRVAAVGKALEMIKQQSQGSIPIT